MRRAWRAFAAATALAAVAGVAGIARAAPGAGAVGSAGVRPPLLVSFADHPSAAVARHRLAGLGRVASVVPEVGIWSVAATRPERARSLALARAGVRSAEWSLERRVTDAHGPGQAVLQLGPAPAITNPLYGPATQWGLFTGRWSPALISALPRPRIAILDSGVDPTHPEWSGPQSPLVDAYSVFGRAGTLDDWGVSGHGTHVAGIAAAPANGVGIVGVAPGQAGQAEVIPVQVADRLGRSTDAGVMRGIRWAVTHGAKVINLSLGGPGYSRATQATIDWAFRRGAVVVASVGNSGQDTNELDYPAAYAHVIGVGAQCDAHADLPDCPTPFGVATFSEHNAALDLVAPGVNVLSTVPLRVRERLVAPGYAVMSGTSMAAPYVAGVAALVFAAHPGITPYQVTRQLEVTATRLGSGVRDDRRGFGVVNPTAAVTTPAPPDSPEPNDDVRQVARVPALIPGAADAIQQGLVQWGKDAVDVVPVRLARGQVLRAVLTHPAAMLSVGLWRPGTRTVLAPGADPRRDMARIVVGPPRKAQVLAVRAPRAGRYLLVVRAERGTSTYSLRVSVRG